MNDTLTSAEVQREIEAVRKASELAARDPEFGHEPHLTMDRYLRLVWNERRITGPTGD